MTKLRDEHIQLLAKVAIEAPLKQGKYSVSATIDWRTVDEIRAELERLGVDWRRAHKRAREIRDQRVQAILDTKAGRSKVPA